jgi:hypothetical protein
VFSDEKIVSALGFENSKFMEHPLPLQSADFGLTLTQLRKAAFRFVETRLKLISLLRNVWQGMTGQLGS